MEQTASNSSVLETKVRGKFGSLSKQEAEMVLETYVKRSLSSHESRTVSMLRAKKVQRSVSDMSKFTHRKKSIPKRLHLKETEKITVDGTDNKGMAPQTSTAVKTKSVKKASWFKKFLNSIFKTQENVSEQSVTVVHKAAQDTASASTDETAKRTSLKKHHIRRVLSLKKNAPEEETKLKRPSHLPLKHINKPLPFTVCEKTENFYYQQVSEEIELLVKDADNLEIGDRKPSVAAELDNQDTESVIKKIVSILQKQGDAYDRKIKEDPTLNGFFRDFSYNSFKQLADVYVEKEVKKRGSDITPEDMKFAFSVHFTKQVVGLSSHPVNRIMGFGSQYLQDTFTWLSCNMEHVDVCPEVCISPD